MPQSPPELVETHITPPDAMPGYVFPGYEFLGIIGSGGFGTVFKARQLRLGRVIAVKVIRPDIVVTDALAARFEAEAMTLGKLHHPNIVEVYDSGQHGGRIFIAMEQLEGEDLGQRIARCGPLSECEAWAIARQAATALAHAAVQGIVHRDVKPSNLHLVPAPTGMGLPPGVPLVKVTDFGLARTCRLDEASGDLRSTSGVIVGTPAYMAPEQCRAAAGLDHRADIYALGSTIYHSLTGHPPFFGKTVWDVMARKQEHALRFDSSLSRKTIQLLTDMLAPDPNKRVQSYEELIARIDGSSVRVARRSAHRLVLTAVGALAVAIVGATTAAKAIRDRFVGQVDAPLHPPLVRYQPSGPPGYLFNGTSLNNWLPPPAGGQWSLVPDEEGVKVLSGTGFTRREFAPRVNFSVTIGLDVYQSSSVEVQFAIPANKPDARRLVIRITRAEGAVFGTRNGDRGTLTAMGEPVRFPTAAWFDGRRPYLEVKFERAGGWWRAWFHGQEAGMLVDDELPKLPELRVLAEGGPVRIDTVIHTPLQRQE